jgi:hypothetical protein
VRWEAITARVLWSTAQRYWSWLQSSPDLTLQEICGARRGTFSKLEDQMCAFTTDFDRARAAWMRWCGG